ncbi:unnamed protein product [Ranitomeya imitator]|uniref:Uncharacterized protein n=1 Tax=Ranitomeya imitator TaxID=111125 RepID=A0ABN9LTY6_9NEOB|nr:unnamed protein product [Ranitomeya imitator]
MVPSVDPPAPVLVEGELEYIVEKILDSRVSRRKLQYLLVYFVAGSSGTQRVYLRAVSSVPTPYQSRYRLWVLDFQMKCKVYFHLKTTPWSTEQKSSSFSPWPRPLLMHPMILFALAAAAWHWLLQDIVPVYQIKGISKLVKLCLPKVQCFCDSLTSPPSERQPFRGGLTGIAAATIFNPSHNVSINEDQLRVAFDGDAVLFSDESEQIVKEHGLDKFFEHEKAYENKPLAQGPLKGFLESLGKLQKKFYQKGMRMNCPIRTYLCSQFWGASPKKPYVAGALKLTKLCFWGWAGAPKGPMLEKIRPHIFFDDQMFHIEGAQEMGTIAAHVPYGVAQKHKHKNTKDAQSPQYKYHPYNVLDVDGNQGKHRVTKRGPALSKPMFTLVTSEDIAESVSHTPIQRCQLEVQRRNKVLEFLLRPTTSQQDPDRCCLSKLNDIASQDAAMSRIASDIV